MAAINIFGKLKQVSKTGRMGLSITAPSIVIDTDKAELDVADQAARTLAQTIRSNVLSGLRPDGRPLPEVAPSTQWRREKRVVQGYRGGRPPENMNYGKIPTERAVKNFRLRFGAKKPGKYRQGWWGVESGILAESIRGRVRGKSFLVTVAGLRADTRILARVFKGWGILGSIGMMQPEIQGMLRNFPRTLFGIKAALQAARSVQKIARDIGDIVDDVNAL